MSWTMSEFECPEDDAEYCPCCGFDSIVVAESIYCEFGCELKWQEHGALDESESIYPRPCPHLDLKKELTAE